MGKKKEAAGKKYRPNVALILQNSAGEILIGERKEVAGCWQFPQGGAKEGEGLARALEREVEEEIGLFPRSYEVLERRGGYRYLFPAGRKKEGFSGQEQTYFRAVLREESALVVGGAIQSPEFRALRWIAPERFELGWVSDFKREVYREVFRDFFRISF